MQQQIDAAQKARLIPGPVPILIGASKSQPAEVLAQAIAAGLRDFGENKVQEAMSKWPALKAAHPNVVLHLIGSLQSNKASEAVGLFDVIHTIDRVKIANAVANEMSKQSRDVKLLIQVNTGEEPQKGGVAPRDLPALITHYRDNKLPGLHGLMCVPPADVNPAPHFALLQKLAAEYDLPWLSMGMSSDFATAIRFGATHVRIGTALFGERVTN
jgi:hypothetical protein